MNNNLLIFIFKEHFWVH